MSKLYFSKTHEWILVDGSKGKIGLTEHAAKELGDLVFIELPAVGAKVVAGKTLCNVESVKAVSEIYSPANGTVTKVNETLESSPESVNNAPMDSWIVEIQMEQLPEGLMNESQYSEFSK